MKLISEISDARKEPQWLLQKRMHAYDRITHKESQDTAVFSHDGISGLHDSQKDEVLQLNFSVREYDDDNSLYVKSFFDKSRIIHITADQEKPLMINDEVDSDNIEYVLIVVEPHCHASIMINSISHNPIKRKQLFEIIAKENSFLEFVCMQFLDGLSEDTVDKKIYALENATVEFIEVVAGAKTANSKTVAHLDKTGANFDAQGIFLGSNDQSYDFELFAVHSDKHTKSNLLVRGICADNSSVKYRGLCRINKEASNSVGFQKQDILLLSDNAKADAVPNLEIYNKDVKCGHGATIGHINDQKLFYLASRGLDEATAKNMLMAGFFEPILSKIKNDDTRQRITRIILEKTGVACYA